jgi:hypothetical protein
LGTLVPAVDVGKRRLLEERQEERKKPVPALNDLPLGNGKWGLDPPWGKFAVDVVMLVQGQTNLFEVVEALRASSRFSRRLNRRQQQADQHTDDCNDDE